VAVLLITVLNVDRVVTRRRVRERATVTAAQAVIVGRQAQRATQRVYAAFRDDGERDAAAEEVRTLMTMLLVSAPVLIDAPPARHFLERAQHLGGQLSYALAHPEQGGGAAFGPRLRALADDLWQAAQPLLAELDLEQLAAVDGTADDGEPDVPDATPADREVAPGDPGPRRP
jgi:hypothetical protein